MRQHKKLCIRPNCSSAKQQISHNFRTTAYAIVRQTHACLVKQTKGHLKKGIKKIARHEIRDIAEIVVIAFGVKKIDQEKLFQLAARELSITAIRKITPTYIKAFNDFNLGPAEYFKRFYRDHFIALELPAYLLHRVDPNLRACLKRTRQYAKISAGLRSGRAP